MTHATASHVNAGSQQPVRAHRSNRILIAAALIPAVALFIPLLLPLSTGRVFATDDLVVFHLPLRHLYSEALANGESILWSRHLFNGFYLHAEGQLGALHPLHLAFYRLAPLLLAFNLELVLSYLAAFGGMWVFLTRLGLNPSAAIVGATSFAFSGFNLLHLPHMNAVAVVAHIPWLLAAADWLRTGSPGLRPAAFGAISLLVGSQVLLGYPQYVWISSLVVAIYALMSAGGGAWRPALLVGLASIVGLAVGAAQLLPTLDLFNQSVRPSASTDFALTFSLHPFNLLQLWSPYLLQYRVFALPGEYFVHEFGLYNGALCTLAFVWILFRWRQLHGREAAAFGLALCVVGFVLALGRYGLVYEQLTVLPVVGKFRAPARHVVMVHLGLSILLAVAFADLAGMARASGRRTRLPWVAGVAGLSTVTAACVWLMPGVIPSTLAPSIDVFGALAGVALFGIAALLVHDAARGSQTALAALPLFAALDLGLWGYSYVWSRSPLTVTEVAQMAELPPAFSAHASVHIGDLDARRNLALLHGLKLLQPYVGLVPIRRLDADSVEAQRLGGVEWVHLNAKWSRVPNPFPRVRVLSEAHPTADPAADVGGTDLSRVALTATAIAPLDGDARGDAQVVVDESGRMEIDVLARGRALLATTESYHAGWTATAGGRELVTVPLFGDYLGVVLEPGEYRLRLQFRPASTRTGVFLSLGGLVLTLAIAAVSLRRGSSPNRVQGGNPE